MKHRLIIIFGVLLFLYIPTHRWYNYIWQYQVMNRSNPIEGYTYISKGYEYRSLGRDRLGLKHYYFIILYQSNEYKVDVKYTVYKDDGNNLPPLYFSSDKNKFFSQWECQLNKKFAIIWSCLTLLFVVIPVTHNLLCEFRINKDLNKIIKK